MKQNASEQVEGLLAELETLKERSSAEATSLKTNISNLEAQVLELVAKSDQLWASLEDERSAATRLTEVIAGLRESLKA